MTPRRRSLVALVASAAVLVGSGIAFAVSQPATVGTDLDQVTTAAASGLVRDNGRVGRDADRSTPQAQPQTTDEQSAALPDVPVTDATQIVIPEPVDPPQLLSIASVSVQMPVAATGVTADDQMELPDDPSVIGWYKFGAVPGAETGSTVLGGHVDSIANGIGPLARLASTSVGDEVVVTGGDGEQLRYQVVSVERISKAALPVDVLFRPDGPHQLAVVTCGGRYLPEAGGYEDNIVVIARPVAA
jgi:sortase (surface protein transpeptidase)